MIAPLALFLLLVFLVPIAALLYKSVGNPEVVNGLPRTVEAIAQWDGKGLPGEDVYKVLSQDLAESRKKQTLGDLSKRLNMELAGYRSLLAKTARALPFKAEPSSYKDALQTLDERWGDPAYWQAIRRNTSAVTPFYLLAALDHRIDDRANWPRPRQTRPSIWTSSPEPFGWGWSSPQSAWCWPTRWPTCWPTCRPGRAIC